MGWRKGKGAIGGLEDPIVNLTPLIDVVFVVLIMFIVVAPLLEIDRVELAPGGANLVDPVAVKDSSPLTIHVRKDDTIWYHHQKVSLDELTLRLIHEKKRHPGKAPQLFHDRRAQFGTYQSVKNAVEAAGFHEMEIVLKPA